MTRIVASLGFPACWITPFAFTFTDLHSHDGEVLFTPEMQLYGHADVVAGSNRLYGSYRRYAFFVSATMPTTGTNA